MSYVAQLPSHYSFESEGLHLDDTRPRDSSIVGVNGGIDHSESTSASNAAEEYFTESDQVFIPIVSCDDYVSSSSHQQNAENW